MPNPTETPAFPQLSANRHHDVRHDQQNIPSIDRREAITVLQRLLDAEAERGKSTWASKVDIARLPLMRRVPKPLPDEEEFWRFRVLGAIIPELDDLVAAKPASLPTSGTPILPLYLRPALLAGVAIIDRAGPGMLPMLQSHTMGDNRALSLGILG